MKLKVLGTYILRSTKNPRQNLVQWKLINHTHPPHAFLPPTWPLLDYARLAMCRRHKNRSSSVSIDQDLMLNYGSLGQGRELCVFLYVVNLSRWLLRRLSNHPWWWHAKMGKKKQRGPPLPSFLLMEKYGLTLGTSVTWISLWRVFEPYVCSVWGLLVIHLNFGSHRQSLRFLRCDWSHMSIWMYYNS